MQSDSTYLIAGVYFFIDDYNSIDYWNIWKWKLNPYETRNLTNIENKGISVGGNGRSSIPPVKILLHSEEAGFFDRRVYAIADGSTVWCYVHRKNQKIIIAYHVIPELRKIILLQDSSNTSGELALEYLGQIVPSFFLKYGIIMFHGVLMEYEGQGIIISAPSGTGKTTHARLWRDNKHALIINGDRAVCREEDGIWTGFGLPWSGTSGEQINRSVPIKAMVVLERSECNQAFRIGELEAFGAALPNILCPAWDADLTGKAMDLLNDFLQEIPVIRLQCRPDSESVEVLSKVLEDL